MNYSLDLERGFADLLDRRYVAAVCLEILDVRLDRGCVASELLGQSQPEVYRQPVQPR
jgi:hypothetical protein